MTLPDLEAIADAVPLTALTGAQLGQLQLGLSILGYPIGNIDGQLGPKTRNAWAEFKTDTQQGRPDLVGHNSIQLLEERVKSVLPATVPTGEEHLREVIRQQCVALGIGERNQVAYVLATVKWETAGTFAPVREAFWLSEDWRRANLPYFPFYGRGFVQLTWQNNYARYGQLLGIDLVGRPDLALDATTALFVLVHGFKTGTFTGRSITDFIDAQRTDFIGARRCINGTDHAADIATLAEAFAAGLAQ
jgi:peptidoglycan hydrolase-like protein with peptidoglycan-binding domain